MSRKDDPKRIRRRAVGRLFQKVQHALPGLALLQSGVAALSTGAHDWHLALAIAQIGTAAVVILALFVAMRALRTQLKDGGVPHPHYGIDWVDIFLGLMLFTEVASHYPERHKIWSPHFLLGIVMIVLGLWGGRLVQWRTERRRAAEADVTR